MCRNSFEDIILMLVELEVRNWKICKAFNITYKELKEMVEDEKSRLVRSSEKKKRKS